jgi:LCP family protein required for cell wall assembly
MRYVDLGTIPPPRRKPKNKKRFFKATLMILGFVVALYALATLFLPSGNIIREVLNAPGTALGILNDPLKAIKSTDGRTNILVLGIDKRKDIPYSYKGAGGKTYYNGFLSDTMIVASINLSTKDVALISLPRDLWVEYGGSGGVQKQGGKINAVYATGTVAQYPAGGVSLAKETVQKYLGLDIHYGVRVDFEAFRRMINSVGGINLTVDTAFEDYQYPVEGRENAVCSPKQLITSEGTSVAVTDYSCRYEVIRFTTGPQEMNGDTALKFVRSRHGTNGEGSDFARAARQQKVLIGLKNKILSNETLFDPIKIAKLVDDFGDTIETDFDLATLPGLFKLGSEFDDQKIRNVVLNTEDNELLINPDSSLYGGAYVLVPKDPTWKEVQLYLKQVLAEAAIPPTSTPASARQ